MKKAKPATGIQILAAIVLLFAAAMLLRHGGLSATPASSDAARNGYSTDFSDSLRGKVSNTYNIRDDILKYINDTYGDSPLKPYFIRYAAAQQDFIEFGSTREAAIYHADRISQINACLFDKLGPNRYEEKGAILAMALNTESRFRAYWKAVDLQSNRATVRPRGDPCE